MQPYLAWIWDAADGAASEAAMALEERVRRTASWQLLLCAAGVRVWMQARIDASASPLQVFPVGCGVLIGAVFPRPDPQAEEEAYAPLTFSAEESQQILGSGGLALIRRYWGDYIAIFREWNSDVMRVLRGPCATLPCLHMRCGALHVYGSHMEELVSLTGESFRIDWLALARSFLGPTPSGRTHLAGVRELSGGSCDRHAMGRCETLTLWNAADAARDQPVPGDFEDAARTLRRVMRFCVRSRARQWPAILHSLSGGLDSSIVLSCLAPGPSRTACITQFAEDTDSDERPWARLAAARARCRLYEVRRSPGVDLHTAVYSRRLDISPGLRIPAIDRIEEELASTIGAHVIFDGNGGDELFCRVHHTLYVSDYLRAHGMRGEFPALLLHAAFTDGVTVWHALVRSLRDAFMPRRFSVTRLLTQDIRASTLLRKDVLDNLIRDSAAEEWRAHAVRPLPPGRRWQLSLLQARRTRPAPFAQATDPVRISPLLCQPLLELALPTWFQMRGRRDRALARHAFACELPAQIVQRRDKGGAESLAVEILERNRGFLRTMLSDGLLVQAGLIDVPRLHAALDEALPAGDVTSVPLFDLLGAEIWARAWLAPSQTLANPLQTYPRVDRADVRA